MLGFRGRSPGKIKVLTMESVGRNDKQKPPFWLRGLLLLDLASVPLASLRGTGEGARRHMGIAGFNKIEVS